MTPALTLIPNKALYVLKQKADKDRITADKTNSATAATDAVGAFVFTLNGDSLSPETSVAPLMADQAFILKHSAGFVLPNEPWVKSSAMLSRVKRFSMLDSFKIDPVGTDKAKERFAQQDTGRDGVKGDKPGGMS